MPNRDAFRELELEYTVPRYDVLFISNTKYSASEYAVFCIQNSRLFPFIVITGFIVSIITLVVVRLSWVMCKISLDVELTDILNITWSFASFTLTFCITFIEPSSMKNGVLRFSIMAVTFDIESVTLKETVTLSPVFAYRLLELELDIVRFRISKVEFVFKSPYMRISFR